MCYTFDLRWFDALRFTTVSYETVSSLTGTFTMDYLYPSGLIAASSLAALQDLWKENCMPYLPPSCVERA